MSCTTAWAIPAYEPLLLEIPVTVNEPAGTEATLNDVFSVSGGTGRGGGAIGAASLERPFRVSEQPVTFGVEKAAMRSCPKLKAAVRMPVRARIPFS